MLKCPELHNGYTAGFACSRYYACGLSEHLPHQDLELQKLFLPNQASGISQ